MPIRIVKRANAPIVPKTLFQVVEVLSKKFGLAETRRRDLISACNSFARLTGEHPRDIPAEIDALRSRFAGLHHVQGRITRKRLANIRAGVAAALLAVGVLQPQAVSVISSAWMEFIAKATAKHQGWGLARFARFCSTRQIDPASVDDDVLLRFRRYLEDHVLTNDPFKIARETAKNFNTVVKRGGLGYGLLKARRGDHYVTPPLAIYPVSLQLDVDCYLKKLEKPDLFSTDGPGRSLRPTSLRNIRAHIRQTLDAAVTSGYRPDHFKTLSDLVDIDVLRAATEQIVARSDGRTPSSLLNILATLLAIARYHVRASDQTIKSIAAAKRSVAEQLGGAQQSMSQKSQRRMDQFLNDGNVAKLIELPEQLIRRPNRNPGSQDAAIDAMVAAAIALLLACPALRMANLAALNISEDLTRDIKGKRVSFLVHIIPKKTKGRQAIDAIIEPPLSTIIDQYLTRHRHRLADQPKDWIFPKRSGGPRSPSHLSGAIAKKIFDETGIVMNPHLFRHLCGALFLEAHPGEFESVRRLISHAKMETTVAFYAPLSNRAASERYAKVLQGFRKERK